MLWMSALITGDNVYNHQLLKAFVPSFESQFQPIPSREYQKIVLQSKYGVLRFIYLRFLKEMRNVTSVFSLLIVLMYPTHYMDQMSICLQFRICIL